MTALRCAIILAVLTSTLGVPARAQEPASTFELTVANIMRGPELVGESPSRVRWTDDGRWIYFRWKPGGRPWDEEPALYRVRADGGEPERLSEEAADSLGVLIAPGDVGPDERLRVVTWQGDLFVIDRGSLDVRRLTRTLTAEDDPVFGRDGRTVFFVGRPGGDAADNVFAMSVDDGSVRQLTNFRPGPAPDEDEEAEGQRRFLEQQQEELFDHVRRRLAEEEREEQQEEAREAAMPEAVYLEREERVLRLAIEPGGRFAMVEVGSDAEDARGTIVPDYVTSSGYTEPLEVRGKVGDTQDRGRVGVVSLDSGEVRWLRLGADGGGETATTGVDTARAERSTADAADPTDAVAGDTPGDTIDVPRLAATRFLGWSEDGTRGLVGAVAYDYKDQWLYVIDAATGEATRIAHDRDDAWIGGPCGPWLDPSCAGWLPTGDAIYFVSERDGFSHLYRVAVDGVTPEPTAEPAGTDGARVRQLTSGDWAVYSVSVSPDDEHLYLTTSEGSPFELHFYRSSPDGSDRTRLTTRVGRHDVVPSPTGERLAVVYSSANRPPDLFVMADEAGAEMRRITSSPTQEWLSYAWIEPEIVWFEARDGVRVPARIYRPRDVGAEPTGAGVIFVHGAGYLHNVHRWWSSYYREYMFHHLLAARGYTVLDIDYRGSAGYGRAWRTAIYRNMGGKDLADQVDGARYLAAQEGVDPARIGIYGGSYGGFITLMALFKESETFAAGAALRSVTDWAHYNHWYTSRILNLPQEDTEAYRRSSPIYFAEGLEDPLLIAHGMVDTNVHFQDVVRLAQRLIELGKTDWEMAVYPAEGHGFVEPSSWTDEYRRILALFERHIGGQRRTTDEE